MDALSNVCRSLGFDTFRGLSIDLGITDCSEQVVVVRIGVLFIREGMARLGRSALT